MELKQLFAGIPFSGALPDGDAVSVTMDSRRVKPGTVFVCTRGATADGHAFAAKALTPAPPWWSPTTRSALRAR